MTPEEKQLLLKDLCARIPNHVKAELHGEVCTVLGYFDDFVMLTSNTPLGQQTNIANIKLYLRPMSSMTEEEKEQCRIYRRDIMFQGFGAIELYMSWYTEWLDSKHFDWRIDGNGKTLIQLGLALEAPEGMYKTE